jgi:hypothetical protein
MRQVYAIPALADAMALPFAVGIFDTDRLLSIVLGQNIKIILDTDACI